MALQPLPAWLARYDWGHLWTALTTARPVGPHSPIDMMKRVDRAMARARKPDYETEIMDWRAARLVPRYEV